MKAISTRIQSAIRLVEARLPKGQVAVVILSGECYFASEVTFREDADFVYVDIDAYDAPAKLLVFGKSNLEVRGEGRFAAGVLPCPVSTQLVAKGVWYKDALAAAKA